MQFSIAKEIFGSPWQISARGIQQYHPVVVGMLNGAEIVIEEEPKENFPYLLSANTLVPLAWSDDEEEDPADESTKEKVIHVLPVRGVMMKHDMLCGPRGTRTLANRLLNADADSSVIGHIMIIEGPGGAVNAIPELTDAMIECKKPIVVWVDGMMCSAHMYVASYAKEIIASRANDLVGCIGTLIMFTGRKSKSEEDLFNVREVTIYADDAFEKNEEYEKAINDFDFKLTKENILNPHNKQFIADIKKNRTGVEDKHLHGKTFPAGEVIGALVDSIGSFDDAVQKVLELSKYEKEDKTAQGSSKGQAAQNQSIKTDMKQFGNVNAALGVESLEAVDEVVSLNEDQLQAIDTALEPEDNSELQGELNSANEIVAERDATIVDLNANVETSNTTITERDTTIKDLQDEVAELKGEPATTRKVAKTKTDGDGKSDEDKALADKYENPFEALDEVSQEFLGKSING